MIETGFVILHYGDKEVTGVCVRSILSMDFENQAAIVIVDNDRENSDPEKWQEYRGISWIHILRNTENHGFSHANNLGYRYAREILGAKTILVLNNDIEFRQKEFLKKLEASFRHSGSHIIAPEIRKRSGREPQNPLDTRLRSKEEAEFTVRMNKVALRLFPIVFPFITLQQKMADKKRVRQKKEKSDFYHNYQEQIIPFGACLIFTELFVRAEENAFEPETQFYYEEYLLALRCFRKGYRISYDPRLKLLHDSGSATRKSLRTRRAETRFLLENTAASCQVYLNELEKR